jgi:hypothetical protein
MQEPVVLEIISSCGVPFSCIRDPASSRNRNLCDPNHLRRVAEAARPLPRCMTCGIFRVSLLLDCLA